MQSAAQRTNTIWGSCYIGNALQSSQKLHKASGVHNSKQPCQVHQKILITNYDVLSEIPMGQIS